MEALRRGRMNDVSGHRRFLIGVLSLASTLGVGSCTSSSGDVAGGASCGLSTSADSSPGPACGTGDVNLPPEPSLPSSVCQTLAANKSTPDESQSDTLRIQAALTACAGLGAVKLTRNGDANVFLAGHLSVIGTVLWVDQGVTLYASRNASFYENSDGNCGLTGVSDSSACLPLLSVSGASAGVVGGGVIDGQGGEPLVGQAYSWWDLSNALRSSNGSAPNPALIEVKKATGFVMYQITLHNSPKAHVKLSASPASGSCTVPGSGYTVWGVTIETPSRWTNSQGRVVSPYYARNTDGFDPGEFAATSCGVMACNTITTGDDQISLKGAYGIQDITIAHNHFGSGHGMSIGSETNGGVAHIDVYDLTIDADSRWSGAPDSDTSDFNGIRVKSDESRGGTVSGVTFADVCTRDIDNPIVIDSSYNPLFGGTLFPQFGSITVQNFHAVTCASLMAPIVDIQGFNAQFPAGPLTLDNVVVDGIAPPDVAAQFTSVTLGPGNVNFFPAGNGAVVTDAITGTHTPVACSFPALPAPQVPDGWLW
jgi:polygalacturonase